LVAVGVHTPVPTYPIRKRRMDISMDGECGKTAYHSEGTDVVCPQNRKRPDGDAYLGKWAV